MGFDLPALRDLFGEPEAILEDFIAVATGDADFETLNQRREFEKWALEKDLSKEQREMVLMVCDFKRANPDITPDFNQFGEELWEVANVFRDDSLHATARLETFSLFSS